MARAGIIVLLVFVCATAQAKVYKWLMPDGTTQYSDRPQEAGAKEVELPPLQIYSAPAPARPAPPAAEPAPEKGYESVQVVSPKNGEAMRDNGGTVSVQIAVKPELHPGHTVEIRMDGKSVGSGRGVSASVTNVDRGTHTVSAVINDQDGKTVASAPGVTFHLQRASRRN